MTHPEMSAATLAVYLRRIRLTRSVAALSALAAEINREHPTDDATPRPFGVIGVRVKRLAGAN